MGFKNLFGLTLKGSINDNDRLAIKDSTIGVGNAHRNILFSTVKNWILAFQDIVDNIAYRDRVKTKVLWTGPLSVVSTPTSLNVGEKFSDWDQIVWYINVESDTSNQGTVPVVHCVGKSEDRLRAYGPSGSILVDILSDTTFRIEVKTVTAGNIASIIGISL